MRKLTNLIGSSVIAAVIITFPVIVGVGMASDWLEENINGVLIHPGLAILWTLCVGCTMIEIAALGFIISNTEVT